VALRRWRCRGEDELRGVVQFGEGARGVLYRAKRGAEGARLRRWAAVPAVAAINGVRLGGATVSVEGKGREVVRRRGSARPVGRWSARGSRGGGRRRGVAGGHAGMEGVGRGRR
jgi:hypothetical protein